VVDAMVGPGVVRIGPKFSIPCSRVSQFRTERVEQAVAGQSELEEKLGVRGVLVPIKTGQPLGT
jgi:hypothetical protein